MKGDCARREGIKVNKFRSLEFLDTKERAGDSYRDCQWNHINGLTVLFP